MKPAGATVRTLRRVTAALGLVAVAGLACARGGDVQARSDTSAGPGHDQATIFAGRADPLQANLSLLVQGDQVAGYLCTDGTMAEWFIGRVADGRAEEVSADGDTRLTATFDDDHARADVIRDGQTITVDGEPADGDAGLHRAEAVAGDQQLVAARVR